MKKRYPVKQDLNLAQIDQAHRARIYKTILIVVVIVMAAAAVCQFAIFNRFAALEKAVNAAVTAESQLEKVRETTTGYDELVERHRTATVIHGTVSYEIDPLERIELLESHLLAHSKVSDFYSGGRIISVQFSGVTLHEVSAIYSALMAHGLVENVQVFTASTDERDGTSDQVTATMTIHLAAGEKDGESAS